MKKLLLLVIICTSFIAKAQVYHPMFSGDTVEWKTISYGMIGPLYNILKTFKDTTFGGYTYKAISNPPNYMYPTYLREDSLAQKVYGIVMGADQLIYDFSVPLHDSVYIHWQNGSFGASPLNGYYVVDSVATTSTIAGPRKFMHLVRGYENLRWLEGVGVLDDFINFPSTYCDIPDCSVFTTVYCQSRDGVNTWERSPLYTCDSGLIYDCSTHTTATHNDSNYVFSVQVNGIGPYTYKWQCSIQDSLGSYVIEIDSSFYPNAHFVLPYNKHYLVSVIAVDTSGCTAYGSVYVYDTIPTVSVCNAFFWIYPTTVPEEYNTQNLSTGTNLTYLWDFGDGSTSAQALPTHQYATAARYTICLTVNNGNGCVSTYCDSTFYDYKFGGGPMLSLNAVPTAIGETEKDKEITVYPNPVGDVLSITISSAERPNSISVYDVTGNLISVPTQKVAQGYSLSTTALAPGMYAIVFNWGSSRVVKRFVKK